MAHKKQNGFTTLEMLLVIVILAVIGYVGYYVYHSRNATDSLFSSASNTQVAVRTKTKKTPTTTTTQTTVSTTLTQNVSDSIKSGNTAALQGYMADSVNVVIAGSEKSGSEATLTAIKDLDYLNSATAPWDFALSTTTLTAYANGAYQQYFGGGTIVGQSANGYVVSFHVNSSGKIDTIFMANSADQLK